MKDEIISNLNNPAKLENMYRANKAGFKKAFALAYPGLQHHAVADTWYERLNFEKDEMTWGSRNELFVVFGACFTAGLIAKLPFLMGWDTDVFFPRNVSLIVLPALMGYLAWKYQAGIKKIAIAAMFIGVSAICINLLPGDENSDTLVLACAHLPVLLWAVTGFVFTGRQFSTEGRLEFLRYNGDLAVMTAVFMIAGGITTGITMELFRMIGMQIQEFYREHVLLWVLPAVPIAATFLVRNNPQLVGKVSPLIAKLFTPLVLLMLVIYLGAVLYTGKDPYNDRDFLMIFNVVLVGVMALILFSVAETVKGTGSTARIVLLLALSIVTIIVNGIVLSAILFRMSTWGITPNRLAVSGGNMLILVNLLIVAFRLLMVIKHSNEEGRVARSIAVYLPVYAIWAIIVVFVFPLAFGFR